MGRSLFAGAQCRQTVRPQRRQWCRRNKNVNAVLHSMHAATALSGVHFAGGVGLLRLGLLSPGLSMPEPLLVGLLPVVLPWALREVSWTFVTKLEEAWSA